MSEFTSDAQGNPKSPKRDLLYTRWGQLKAERASWWSTWKDLNQFILPRQGRFFREDRDKGWRRENSIYDNTATRNARILASGMMSGMTSPARPWFRLGIHDKELGEYQPVRVWLNDVTNMMLNVFQKSNTYRAFHQMYMELGVFGTGTSIILPDYKNIIHHYPLTIGEYCIASNYRGMVDTIYREFQMTVAQVVNQFGLSKCSTTVKNMYNRGTLDAWVTIIHAIEPRSDRDPTKKDALNMAWKSVYFEIGGRENHYLSESGFNDFPAIAPRWGVTGGDIYGYSPGMECLGDVKQLQHEQLRKAQVIDFKTKPPLQAPASMKNRDVDLMPGGVTFVDMNANNGGIKSAFEVNIDLQHLLMDIQDVRQRIGGSFYSDLFLMLANGDNTRMTATEVAERHEEKMLMLGPVLERLQNEMLSPFIELTFQRMLEAGVLPPPPEELQGQDIAVEFVSMLAQAQKAIGANTIDRFAGTLGQIAAVKPEVLDKFDADQWADIYSDILGVNPELILADDKVAIIREQRAKAQQAAAAQESMAQMSASAKNLAGADMNGNNALTNVMSGLQGYNSSGQ